MHISGYNKYIYYVNRFYITLVIRMYFENVLWKLEKSTIIKENF